jgi:glycosyltransferase involved in cell wall biosynthesis
MLALQMAVSRFRPSIVHSFSRLLYLAPLLPRRIPKIMSYQRFAGGRQISLAALVGGSSLMFTGCSKFIATMGGKYGGAWHAIPNFVDTDFYEFTSRAPDDAPLVFLSRVEREKGAHWAIEIAKKTGRRLLIAGNYADDGPQRQYWDHMIKPELGNNGIEYVGTVGDEAKRQLLGSAAAMVVPIQWDEPFGIVFAEALACGTPVITCPRGATPEIIRDGIDGFLIRDVSEGCRAVQRLGAIDRRQCRERAEQAFSVAAVVPQYEALYEELLQRP